LLYHLHYNKIRKEGPVLRQLVQRRGHGQQV
jgi:hypothetical protein